VEATNDYPEVRVHAIIGRLCPHGEREISPTDRIVDDLGYHSVKLVELTIELEAEFDVMLCDEKVAGMQTVGDLSALIAELTADLAA
jgi:acyl carrier protein